MVTLVPLVVTLLSEMIDIQGLQHLVLIARNSVSTKNSKNHECYCN